MNFNRNILFMLFQLKWIMKGVKIMLLHDTSFYFYIKVTLMPIWKFAKYHLLHVKQICWSFLIETAFTCVREIYQKFVYRIC